MKYHTSKLVLYCCLIIIFLRLKQSWSTCFEFQGSHIASSSRSENHPQLARRHSKRFGSYDVISVVNYVDCYVTTYSKYLLQPSSKLFWDTRWQNPTFYHRVTPPPLYWYRAERCPPGISSQYLNFISCTLSVQRILVHTHSTIEISMLLYCGMAIQEFSKDT